ncbi:hypothetical protein [Alkalimonas amylolytica]|uniref:DUF2946 domain-containing protein n=1 Tax=Alkalimonas amylolytica TaxID=152573 RepID=A0A1H4BIC9_ALKAM|nr:hypothetical protein [Alkalimonas amylolytica]SEA47778.1 hypothetical protein SAMN04488051_103372 [Alkalimonas amylolytica]
MLSTLVQRQKIWAIPMMVSLALSWCLLFCGQLFAASHHAELQAEVPSCHGVVAEAQVHELLPEHDLCSGCALDAVQTATPELPAVVLWLQAVIEPVLAELPAEQHSLYLAQGPPYPRTTPLYLEKSLLLI